MHISHFCALSGALLLASSSSREPPPAPTPAAPAATAAAPAPPPALAAPVAKDAVFGREQLGQMLALVALYPDPLLAQVSMAATYPGDVTEAAAWSKAHPDAKRDQAVWDPSVQSPVAFPQALATLGQDPPWVQRLGDAFLAQPDDVMDAVQRLRQQAQSAGNLARALAAGLAFGARVAITDSLWGDFDWDDNDIAIAIDIDVDNYNNISSKLILTTVGA